MNKKIVLSSFVGNALEFFDFTLCGVFMMTLSNVFFPATDPNLSILAGIFTFSAAFYTRPIGALLFGYLGDTYGRKKILSVTVFLMGIPTFVIGILPSYESIGLFAPITLIACRLLQGLCTGGFRLRTRTKRSSWFCKWSYIQLVCGWRLKRNASGRSILI